MADLPLFRHDRDIENCWARARIDALLAAGARTILDVGCVDGFVLDEYPQARGIDARPIPPAWESRAITADITAERLPTAVGPWDIVICISTIEHVGLGFYGDPTAHGELGPALAFSSLVRLTAPGGHILLTVPIGLTRQEGAGAARYWTISERDVMAWCKDIRLHVPDVRGVHVLEWLMVTSPLWSGYPDPVKSERQVLLAVLKKKEA